jgi:hypothetical protein
MPLLELQTALATLVTWRASADQSATTVLPSLAGLNLTADEQTWLAQLSGTPGFDATCYIQRWWRETKLRWTTRLTLAALGAEQGTALLKAYLNITPCASLFFTPEALGFLDFVARETKTLPHVAEIAQFERAMIVVRDAAHQFTAQKVAAYELEPDQQLAPHPAAALLAFAAPPEELLGALVQSICGVPLHWLNHNYSSLANLRPPLPTCARSVPTRNNPYDFCSVSARCNLWERRHPCLRAFVSKLFPGHSSSLPRGRRGRLRSQVAKRRNQSPLARDRKKSVRHK